ncbi:AraC family transcriptional regulator, partial [Pseudomonas sp. MWU13-2625]
RRAFGESPRAFMLRGYEHRGPEGSLADDEPPDDDAIGAVR